MFGAAKATVWTIGHSNRTWEDFLALLQDNRIERLVDVRHFPASARVPWTNRDALEANLVAAGIRYDHVVDLGGYRKPWEDSKNTGWRNPGFRGYADHMDSEAFQAGLERLIASVVAARTAIMCAEAVPWHCHRSLLSDALLAQGVRVIHILSPGKHQDHVLTAFARVHGGRVTYPAARGKG